MQKQIKYIIKGMNRDLSISKANNEFSFENMNIRITARDANTLLSVTNERGNKEINLNVPLEGVLLGYCVLNNTVTLFTKSTSDNIYKVIYDNTTFTSELLYKGTLGFNTNYPIECIGIYENENIQKVYWTDGLNQPRFINIATALEERSNWTNKSFDFISNINVKEVVNITKNTLANGVFAPGTIQYAFTYYNKYGQESNIFYTSPLFYTSHSDRGGSPEDKVGNSFNIEIEKTDNDFDYIRVYSILRTSLDATPIVKRVVDLATPSISTSFNTTKFFIQEDEITVKFHDITPITPDGYRNIADIDPEEETSTYKLWLFNGNFTDNLKFSDGTIINIGSTKILNIKYYKTDKRWEINNSDNSSFSYTSLKEGKVSYTDNGNAGDSLDPTILLYIGGEEIVAKTLAQKDNTLFLGNIKLNKKLIPEDIRTFFKNKEILFKNTLKKLESPSPTGYYPYLNNLNKNSFQFKIFKYLEYYRFGIQFQHKSGKWSEPIWINDAKNTIPIDASYIRANQIKIPTAYYELFDTNIINSLIDEGFINARPVIVYPQITEREAVCQGLLLPTVYNVGDRNSNSPFVQSSWFTRANSAFDYKKSIGRIYLYEFKVSTPPYVEIGATYTCNAATFVIYGYSNDLVVCTGVDPYSPVNPAPINDETLIKVSGNGDATISYTDVALNYQGDWADRDGDFEESINSRAGILTNERTRLFINGSTISNMDMINKGSWAEFRHNYPIPSNNSRNSEIQCIWNPPINPYLDNALKQEEVLSWVSQNSENFYIDQSILTFHSPDIEFDDAIQSLDSSNLKLRIVGLAPLTGFVGDIDIQTSTPPNVYQNTNEVAPGFYKEPIGAENISRFGFKGLMSGAFWFDELSDYNSGTGNTNKYTTGFVVYPFHRNGSLNNKKWATDGVRPSMLDKKKISNSRYSYNTHYLSSTDIWSAFINNDAIHTGISGVSIFNTEDVALVKLKSPKNSSLPDINYYGNVDKVLIPSRIGIKKDGYPIMTTGVLNADTDAHLLFSGGYMQVDNAFTEQTTGVDPVRMKYKSTPHAVIALNYANNGYQNILPTVKDGDMGFPPTKWDVNYTGGALPTNKYAFWDTKKRTTGIYQDVLNITIPDETLSWGGLGLEYGFVWIGELYNDNVLNRFGGQTEEAFENNLWLPCGNSVSLIDNNLLPKTNITIDWIEGDTYYQRYDHLKTYPFSLEEQNAVTDIVSFMCETRINLDGRYDRNRGQTNNFAITPKNFNKLNTVYSQDNNFFNYRAINHSRYNLDYFPNTITWTKEKQLGAITDSWTNITLASTLDLDGDKGEITSLNTFNNEIYAFQRKGFSNVLFNSRVQIPTSDGLPIEISNGLKVSGKRYISNTIGCDNKWSIVESPNGLYFIDNLTNSIYLFNGQLDSISDKLGFRQWVNTNNSLAKWDPVNFNNFIGFYDKNNNDVYFTNKNYCLCFSELLGQFTSFMNYENVPAMFSIENKFISYKNTKLWEQNAGDYNMFYGSYKPYYIAYRVNPEGNTDKIFNNIEFKADSWNNNTLINDTFDKLEAYNEYQYGSQMLTNTLYKLGPLKQKFRIWRAFIPRDNTNKRDRIRNPWTFIKLSKTNPNTYRTELHDLTVTYFE